MHLTLGQYRCQLSTSCVLNLSCDHFNQSCSSQGKITPAVFCHMRLNRHCLTLSITVKQHAHGYVTVEFAILQSQCGGGFKYFHDLQRRSGCRAKLFRVGADAESKIIRLSTFSTYTIDRQRQAVVTLKIYTPGLDRLGATHFLTLHGPYVGNH